MPSIVADRNSLERTRSASRRSPTAIRLIVEGMICLAIAVILFRAFEVEGYMISTGSMAPCLLGYHKRVECPTCRYQYAFGTAYDESVSGREHAEGNVSVSFESSDSRWSVCPNCGQESIDLAKVPRNHGDQLLVYKNAYSLRRPTRWEVVVFRNPYRPTQAYVKRVVALPGESVQIVEGEVYINGRIERKSLTNLRSTRIMVYDHDFEPQDDPEWRPRWRPDPGQHGWRTIPGGFVFHDPPTSSSELKTDRRPVWVTYENWIRSGGQHRTRVELGDLPPHPEVTNALLFPAEIDLERNEIACRGALRQSWLNRVKQSLRDPDMLQAVESLYEQSHRAPITDIYGYNQAFAGITPTAVRDLMISAEVEIQGGDGEIVFCLTDGRRLAELVIDLAQSELRLHIDEEDVPVRSAPLPDRVRKRVVQLEFALVDRQVLAAIDGSSAFAAWEYPQEDRGGAIPLRPVRFGAREVDVRLTSLRLYRDVHYTRGKARNGIDEPFQLGPDEYFVLGDNSPISHDSRNWEDGAVPQRFLLGKPFIVHLPSRPGRIEFGDWRAHVRVPDLDRVRYIH